MHEKLPDCKYMAHFYYYSILIFSFCFFYCFKTNSQETYFYWEGVIIEKDNRGNVPNAHIRVLSEGRTYLFVTDNKGKVNIMYYLPSDSDSIFVTSIGYKKIELNCYELQKINEIIIETDSYSLDEVAITPEKRKKIKTMILGLNAAFALGSGNFMFDSKYVQFIPYTPHSGIILKIRYHIGGTLNSYDGSYKPFRVRLYDKDTVNNTVGKDLLNDFLIITASNNGWLEVDISQYGISMPKNGVYVGLEILPKEYYLGNNIISNTTIPLKIVKGGANNTVWLGLKSKRKNENKIERWTFHYRSKKWEKYPETNSSSGFLINIEVEKTEKKEK